VPCPNCRASGPRESIAPGYFRCGHELYEMRVDTDGVTPRPIYYICGTTYHDAAGLPCDGDGPVCHRCGTFAIVRCTSCGRPLCGDHRRKLTDRWVCGPCLEQHEQDAFNKQVALEQEVAGRYKRLPAWSRPELMNYMTGRSTDLEDGRDRQGSDWTYREVASLLTEALGIERNVGLPRAQHLWTRTRVLTPDGFVVTLEDVSSDAYADRWIPGLVGAATIDARPDELVRGRTDLGLEIAALPRIYSGARSELRSQGDTLLFEEARAKGSDSAWNPAAIAVLLLLVDISLGVYLLAS
jgi:hypothetical protein